MKDGANRLLRVECAGCSHGVVEDVTDLSELVIVCVGLLENEHLHWPATQLDDVTYEMLQENIYVRERDRAPWMSFKEAVERFFVW